MTTYTPFDETKPDPSTQSINEMATSDRDNQQAIVDGVLYGSMKGWDGTIFEGTGTLAKPEYWELDNGSEYIRVTPIWDTLPRPDALGIAWSDDGVVYDNIGIITITWSGNYYSSHVWS